MKKGILAQKYVLALLMLVAGHVYSETNQSLTELTNTIEQYMLNQLVNYSEGRVIVKASTLDPRLN